MDGRPQKILLMYITEVSGHHRASLAIEEALRTLQPDLEIRKINGFRYVFPVLEKVVNKAYMGVIKATPKLWDYLYDNPVFFKRTQGIKEFIHKNTRRKISRLFDEFSPDVVICTQAFPCGLVADYKKSLGLNTTVIGVLTDYAPHSYWLHDGIDFYVVPSDQAKERFVGQGIPEERIRVLGIPVAPKFTLKVDRQKVAEGFGLKTDIPTVLVMGGGQGLGPIKKVVASLVKLPKNIQIIVLAGTNKKLIRFLRKVQKRNLKKLIFLEYTDKVHELMTLASLVVTKPGGMTTAEALSKGLPMVIVKPIPGQEIFNTNYLLSQGVAVRVNRINHIGKDIFNLLDDPPRLQAMRKKAISISRPNSAQDIACLALDSKPANV